LESIQLIREQRDNGKQELAFHTRPFVLCGIPLRRPPQNQGSYARRNGHFLLQIVGHPQFGLPFGQDRLIPIWVATLAIRQKSREVHFDSAAQMLDFFHLPKDGPHYRRLIDGFRRIFGATIFFGTQEQTQAAAILDWARFHFFDRMRLWFNTAEYTSKCSPRRQDNVIVLGEAFYHEIDAHRIPVEREVVAALAHAPGMLDFYIWLVWKSWAINGAPARVPLFSNSGLRNQLGTRDYTADKRFRQTVVSWINRIKVLWPDCPAHLSCDGCFLVVNYSGKSPAINPGPSVEGIVG